MGRNKRGHLGMFMILCVLIWKLDLGFMDVFHLSSVYIHEAIPLRYTCTSLCVYFTLMKSITFLLTREEGQNPMSIRSSQPSITWYCGKS